MAEKNLFKMTRQELMKECARLHGLLGSDDPKSVEQEMLVLRSANAMLEKENDEYLSEIARANEEINEQEKTLIDLEKELDEEGKMIRELSLGLLALYELHGREDLKSTTFVVGEKLKVIEIREYVSMTKKLIENGEFKFD